MSILKERIKKKLAQVTGKRSQKAIVGPSVKFGGYDEYEITAPDGTKFIFQKGRGWEWSYMRRVGADPHEPGWNWPPGQKPNLEKAKECAIDWYEKYGKKEEEK